MCRHIIDTVWLLVVREWRRLIAEPSRMFGIVVQPLLFLVVFGSGFHQSFRFRDSDVTYAGFFFPGVLGLVVLFAAIFATLTLVEDKKCGLFRLVLIGPCGICSAIVGKILATSSLGFVQSLLFLPLGFLVGVSFQVNVMMALPLLFAGSLCFATIGVLFAYVSPSPSAFHALMSVFLIPMWLLSGAMFPLDVSLLQTLALLNPMAYLVDGLRRVLVLGDGVIAGPFTALVGCCLIALVLLFVVVRRRPIE